MVYVTSEQDNQIAVIDAVAARLITTFPAGPRPRSTGFLPDSSRAYISAENGSAVVVADAVAHRVIETIPLAGEMVRPMGIAPSPMGNVFVSTGRGKSVVIIDAGRTMSSALSKSASVRGASPCRRMERRSSRPTDRQTMCRSWMWPAMR